MRVRHLGIMASLAAGAAVAGIAMLWGSGGSAVPAPTPRTWTVVERPLRYSVTMSGILAAGHTVSVAAPFTGLVRARRHDAGDRVPEGTAVVELDTSDIDAALRESRATLLKAEQQLEALRTWETGTEVTRARRMHQAAKASLDDLGRRLRETKGLLDQGIVARIEYESLQQQIAQFQLQEQGARLDLEATLARGGPMAREIAAVERETALRKWEALQAAAGHASVRAPLAGILLRPMLSTGVEGQVPETGSSVRQGEPLFTVAEDSALIAVAAADEFEVHRLAPGMSATIIPTGLPDLALEGRIEQIGAVAKTQASGGGARFEVRVRIDAPEPLRAGLRLGMTCSVAVLVYDNPAAIVVPPEVLSGDRHDALAVVLEKNGGRQARRVELGFSTLDGIEVKSGLFAGDVLLVDR